MPETIALQAAAPWTELRTTQADWQEADPALLQELLAQMSLIRAFEETVLELAGEGLVHGPAHSSIGQEGGAAGSIVGLRTTDQVNGSHRGHHQFLAKGARLRRARPVGDRAFPGGDRQSSVSVARRDPRPRSWLRPWSRRLDAFAVGRGRGDRHERHRRRRRAARRRSCARPQDGW